VGVTLGDQSMPVIVLLG